MTKEIPLTRGKFAIVDDEDYEWLMRWKWHAHTKGYPLRREYPSRKWIKMHNVIWERWFGIIPDGYTVDHKDRNPLMCVRSNLRIATASQQQMNQAISINNKTGFKGVSYVPRCKSWVASIANEYIGIYNSPEEAARAYDAKALEMFGEFSVLNFGEINDLH